jgi:hypothetical protein
MASSAQYLQSDEHSNRNHNVFTLAALGFLTYYFAVMWHELVGHGLTAYLFGAHQMILTSTSLDPDPNNTLPQLADGQWCSRIFYAAGALADIVLGLALCPVLGYAIRRMWSPTTRLFLWLMVTNSLFSAFLYPAYSGISGFGDFIGTIYGWPHQVILRTIETILGLVACYWTIQFLGRIFSTFPESRVRLALIPYAASTIVFCLAGLRLHHATHMLLAYVLPASLLGQLPLPLSVWLAKQHHTNAPLPGIVPLNPVVILVAGVFIVIIWFTAHGVRFTLP